ncbi:MAG TPA: hypothetical protein VK433_04435 [Stellaceae bacterium]|nr:hypothetical protein [Stellaceae bacterium]
MTTYKQELSSSLTSAHRYARALAGDRAAGDWYFHIALEALADEPSRIRAGADVRSQVFRLVNDVVDACAPGPLRRGLRDEEIATGMPPKHGMESLPLAVRQLLLLVTEARFSVRCAAELFDMTEREAELQLAWALAHLRANDSVDPGDRSDLDLDSELATVAQAARPAHGAASASPELARATG